MIAVRSRGEPHQQAAAQNDKKSQQGMAEVATVIQEALTGQRVVKASRRKGARCRFRKVTRVHMKTQMKSRRLRSLTEPI